MTRRDALRLEDILRSIDEIRFVLNGIDREAFMSDVMRRNSVSMSILVISEAARHLSASLKSTRSDIPWADVAAIGNIIRHVYFRIDYDALWTICTTRLDMLEGAARSMLDHIGD